LVIYVHCLGCCVKLIGCPLCGEFKIWSSIRTPEKKHTIMQIIFNINSKQLGYQHFQLNTPFRLLGFFLCVMSLAIFHNGSINFTSPSLLINGFTSYSIFNIAI
jgi:hypothetical protein